MFHSETNFLSVAEANYIKAIYEILEENGTGYATTGEIAHLIDAKGGSVTEMLQKLNEKNILYYTKYKGAQLSVGGIEIARKLIWKHNIWKKFLIEQLLFTEKIASQIAQELEHVQPDSVCERLSNYVAQAQNATAVQSPSEALPQNSSRIVLLTQMQLNDVGVVCGFANIEPDFFDYLKQINLNLGSAIQFKKTIEIAKSVEVLVNQQTTLHIYIEIAAAILVKI